jgi:hypothetical protein
MPTLVPVGAVLAFALFWCGTAGANQLVTISIPDRQGEIPAKWLTYRGPPRANVLLPTGYQRKRAYPLIVLLPGFGNTYAILGPSMLDAQQVLAGLQAIVVSPEGETGWYADWFNNGAYGSPEWESYELDEVMPQIPGVTRSSRSGATTRCSGYRWVGSARRTWADGCRDSSVRSGSCRGSSTRSSRRSPARS